MSDLTLCPLMSGYLIAVLFLGYSADAVNLAGFGLCA